MFAHRKSAMAFLVLVAITPRAGRADFALRDGDTVVFLGDSITAARTYGKIVENYTLLRFPDRKVRFVNAGWGGDTAAGGLKRLDRDVFAHGATVLIVAYGVNDIGWGAKADAEHKQVYLDAIRGIVERCKERGVRVFICSAAITAAGPGQERDTTSSRRCATRGWPSPARSGEGAIDVQRDDAGHPAEGPGRERRGQGRQGEGRPTLHAADGIHLNDLGQLAMAFAILKGLGAPADVSSATIDAREPAVVEAKGCRVTNLDGRRHAPGVRPARRGAAAQLRPVRGPPLPVRADPRRAEPLHAGGEGPARGPVRGHGRRPVARDVRGGPAGGGREHRLGDGRRLGAGRPVGGPGLEPEPS